MQILLLEGPRKWAELILEREIVSGEELIRLHPEVIAKGQLAAEVQSMGFFSQARCICMLDWDAFAPWVSKELMDLPPQIPDVRLVLRVDSGKSKKVPKFSSEYQVEKRLIKDTAATKLLEALEKRYSVEIADNRTSSLLRNYVHDQFDAVLELFEKCAQSGTHGRLDWDTMQLHGQFATEASVFDMMEAMKRGNTIQTMALMQKLQETSSDQLPQLVGGIGFVLRKWVDNRVFPPGKLRQVHNELVQLDVAAKSSAIANSLLLQSFINQAMLILIPALSQKANPRQSS